MLSFLKFYFNFRVLYAENSFSRPLVVQINVDLVIPLKMTKTKYYEELLQ